MKSGTSTSIPRALAWPQAVVAIPFVAIPLGLLAACASGPDQGSLVRASWVGAPVADLVATWGSPTRRDPAGDGERIVYTSERQVHIAGQVGTSHVVNGFTTQTPDVPPMDIAMKCTTVFTVSRGVVSAWSADGNDCSHPPVGARPTAPR